MKLTSLEPDQWPNWLAVEFERRTGKRVSDQTTWGDVEDLPDGTRKISFDYIAALGLGFVSAMLAGRKRSEVDQVWEELENEPVGAIEFVPNDVSRADPLAATGETGSTPTSPHLSPSTTSRRRTSTK